MTKQEKQLLLIDLCARLPYGVKCYFEKDGGKSPVHVVTIGLFSDIANRDDVMCKPYLRPMSSMDSEEIETYRAIIGSLLENSVTYNVPTLYNFLNSKHLDYRGLIPMGLSLEAPEGMYN